MELEQSISLVRAKYPNLIEKLSRVLEPDFRTIRANNSTQFVQISHEYGSNNVINVMELMQQWILLNTEVVDYSSLSRIEQTDINVNTTIVTTNNNDSTGEIKDIISLIYKKIDTKNIHNYSSIITETCWGNNESELTSFFTSSLQSKSTYYKDVYYANPDADDTLTPQFSIAYGNYYGSGSVIIDGSSNNGFTATKTMYAMYHNILPTTNNNKFVIDGNGVDELFIINFNRNRLKQGIQPMSWQINLNGYSFIDDSIDSNNTIQDDTPQYQIVSGSMSEGIYLNESNSEKYVYGLIYPELGILVFDANKLNVDNIVNYTVQSNMDSNAHVSFIDNINRFEVLNRQKINSLQYLISVKNNEFNYSFNPTFVTGSLGDFNKPYMITDPNTYPTTIGLYNDNYDLLAVATIPVLKAKNFYTELSYNIKIDF